MKTLRELVGNTDCFVATCNVDGRFVRAGFDPTHVLETEGSVRELVCSRGCGPERYPSEDVVRAWEAAGGGADGAVVPRCPRCGAPLALAIDERRLGRPDAACREALATLRDLVERHRGGNVVVLELGVGRRNGVIKSLLRQVAAGEPRLTYAIFNYSEVDVPPGLEQACIGVPGDMGAAFAELRRDAAARR